MTKSYSSKSNALRAAAKHDAASVVRNADGAWVVIVANGRDGVDEPAVDDVPVVQMEQAEPAPVAAPDAVEPAAIVEDAAVEAASVVEVASVVEPVDAFVVSLRASAEEAVAIARFIATKYARDADIHNLDTESLVQTVRPAARTARNPAEPRSNRPARDWTVKPIITALSKTSMQKLFDRIEAARGQPERLRALDKFSRSGTYYAMAGNYLDALLAEARSAL